MSYIATGRPNSQNPFRPFVVPRDGFIYPTGVAIFGNSVFVANAGDHAIKMIRVPVGFDQDPSLLFEHTVETLAGGATRGWLDGAANLARFNNPVDLCLFEEQQLLIVADQDNHCIRQVDLSDHRRGEVSTLAGTNQAGFVDMEASRAAFRSPSDVSCSLVAGRMVVVVTDAGNHAIRLVAERNVGLSHGSLLQSSTVVKLDNRSTSQGTRLYWGLLLVLGAALLGGAVMVRLRKRTSTRFVPREYLTKSF